MNVPLDITKNVTLQILKVVLGEVASMFPDPWLHLGGDELPLECLNENEGVAARASAKGGISQSIQSFQKQIQNYLTEWNKTSLFWDDVTDLETFQTKNKIVEVWHGEKISTLLEQGVHLIDTGPWYLDVGCKTTSECHSRPNYFTHRKILGGEACAWELTESECKSKENNGQTWERNFDRVVWKKLIGFAEAVWSRNTIQFDKERSTRAAKWLSNILQLNANVIEIN